VPSRASSLRSEPQAPLTAPGDLRRVAITGSLGTGDSGEKVPSEAGGDKIFVGNHAEGKDVGPQVGAGCVVE
jgi:hypothetical protein